MKKTFEIYMKDNSIITIDAVVKSTNETSIKVHELFEQDTPCLLLSIEHEQLNTLLDLTKTSPYTLLYYHERYIFEAASCSINEIESPFFINTQFKKVLFIPSSVKFSPSAIDKYRIMETVEKNSIEKSHQHQAFLNGYGKFPYIILKPGYAIFMQIPIHFKTNGDYINFPGTNLNDISDELLADYEIDKTSELQLNIVNG